jgi:hypothetical protein
MKEKGPASHFQLGQGTPQVILILAQVWKQGTPGSPRGLEPASKILHIQQPLGMPGHGVDRQKALLYQHRRPSPDPYAVFGRQAPPARNLIVTKDRPGTSLSQQPQAIVAAHVTQADDLFRSPLQRILEDCSQLLATSMYVRD